MTDDVEDRLQEHLDPIYRLRLHLARHRNVKQAYFSIAGVLTLLEQRDALKAQVERLLVNEANRIDDELANKDKLELIREWCGAYPLEVFPEPDLQKAHRVLIRHGMSLDAISASNMRHVLDGVRKIIEEPS
jgi:hypothetical protein